MSEKRVLTDRALRALKPGTEMWDAALPGFGVRVSAKGKASFVVYRRIRNEAGAWVPSRRTVGHFPVMSLAHARDQARALLSEISAGNDPLAAAKRAKQEAAERERQAAFASKTTFRAVAAEFAKRHLSQLRTGPEVARVIERELTARWGDRQIETITRRDIIEVVDAVSDTGAGYQANRVLAYCKTLFRFAVERGYLDNSQAVMVRRPTREERRDRVLTDAELRQIWEACDSLGTFGRVFRMLIATGQRLNEVAAARWGEVDLDSATWTLPGARVKAGRAHVVPLNGQALAVLAECPKFRSTDLVFSTNGRTPVSGWSKAKAALDSASGVSGWRLHDIRRTVATGLARLGTARTTITRALNHADPSVTAIYDVHGREPEVRAALTAWGEFLTRLLTASGDNIVELAQHRG